LDRGRKGRARELERAAASGAAAAGLSGVARGSEPQASGARARGEQRRNDRGGRSWDRAHHGTVCADTGSDAGKRDFLAGCADAACAAQCWRSAAAFGEPLVRANGLLMEEKRRQRSEEHTSELQSPDHLVCRLLL